MQILGGPVPDIVLIVLWLLALAGFQLHRARPATRADPHRGATAEPRPPTILGSARTEA